MKTLRFTRSMMLYRRGDVAVFEDGVADQIVRKGVAELVPNPESESAPAADIAPEGRKRRATRSDDPA
jgi:hypothetical protein